MATPLNSYPTGSQDGDLKAALAEWDAVATVVPSSPGDDSNTTSDQTANAISTPLLTMDEAVLHFKKHNLLPMYKRNIKPTVPLTGFRSCLHFICGPPNLSNEMIEDRDLIFALAAWQPDADDQILSRMLSSIYRRTVGVKIDPARYGSHWDDIGFQGTDPATDLRGAGCLSLIHLLYLTSNPQYSGLMREIYKLSHHPVQNFPFSVMSINMTRVALRALRNQLLNREANRSDDIIQTINQFYVACFLRLFTIWRKGNKTIHDSGYVIQEVERCCCGNVSLALKELNAYCSGTDSAVVVEPLPTFTNIEDLDKT